MPALVASIALVASCTPGVTPSSSTTAERAASTVELATPAQRIVSLAPSNTEILFAIGAGDRLIGRDERSDYPPQARKIKSVGNLYPKIDVEGIVLLEPDLVLAAGVTNPDDVKALSRLGLAVHATSISASLEDIYEDILAVGKLTGKTSESSSLVATLKARVEKVTAETSKLAHKPKVLYEIDATDPAKPWTAGPGSFIDQMLTLAGGRNVAAKGNGKYFQISLEELLTQDPAIIILGSSTYGGQTPELVKERVAWKNISAVKTGAVYVFNDELISRPGPRVVTGLEMLARLIHPELFQ